VHQEVKRLEENVANEGKEQTHDTGGWALTLGTSTAKDADVAVAAAWAAYKPDQKWPLKVTTEVPDKDGWSKQRSYDYQTSPNEKRSSRRWRASRRSGLMVNTTYGAPWCITAATWSDSTAT
jgi:hypothetical protein